MAEMFGLSSPVPQTIKISPRKNVRPKSMPTPAAPKPQCHPMVSPRKPVTSWPKNAPRLMPM